MLFTCLGMPFVQVPVVHRPFAGVSVSSFALIVPPIPSHSTSWQSPAVCGGFTVVGVPAAVKVVPHLPAVQDGCWQSLIGPLHSESSLHSTQFPAPSQ